MWYSCSRCIVLLVLLLAGCAKGGDVHLTGNVTIDGKPLENGEIRFASADGRGTTAGAVVKEGRYDARVPRGQKSVHIVGYKVVGHRALYQDDPNSPIAPIMEQIAEQTFKCEIVGGGTRDFALKTPQGARE